MMHLEAGEPSPSLARPKPDMLSEASEYRKLKDVLLHTYTCTDGEDEPKPIVVFCPYAGKPGRPRASNNHNKDVTNSIMGATVMWLVCPYINAMIGRMEGLGVVKTMNGVLQSNTTLAAAHIASHELFEKYVCESLLRDASESAMYRRNFIDIDQNKKKFGNAGVSHAVDMKCYHALVAQTLGGADNPIGSSLVLYFFHLFDILESSRSPLTPECAPESERKVVPNVSSMAPVPDQQTDQRHYGIDSEFVKIVENQDNYFAFLTSLGPDPANSEKWRIDLKCPSMKVKCEKLPWMCRDMILALEGKSLSMRKKRRLN